MGVADYMTVTRSGGWWCASAVIGDRLVTVRFDDRPSDDLASLRLLERAGVCVHCERARCECCLECGGVWSSSCECE